MSHQILMIQVGFRYHSTTKYIFRLARKITSNNKFEPLEASLSCLYVISNAKINVFINSRAKRCFLMSLKTLSHIPVEQKYIRRPIPKHNAPPGATAQTPRLECRHIQQVTQKWNKCKAPSKRSFIQNCVAIRKLKRLETTPGQESRGSRFAGLHRPRH